MKSLVLETIFYLYLAAFVALIKAKSVTLFENEDGEGDFYSAEIEGLQCYNIPAYFNNKASSVDLFGNCVYFYEDSDCRGRNIGLESTLRTQKYKNLGKFDLNDTISSFRQCDGSTSSLRSACSALEVQEHYYKAPDLKDVALKMRQTIEKWYSRICRLLWSPVLKEHDKIYLIIDEKTKGSAVAHRNQIHASASYYRRHPDDMGSIIYAVAHSIQQFRWYSTCPKWLREAFADYSRNYFYEKDKPTTRIGEPEGSSYADLLKWVNGRWPNTVYRLSYACATDNFDNGLLQRITGKNESQLREEMKLGC